MSQEKPRRLTPEEAHALVERVGGKRPAARALGVPISTFRSWLDPEVNRERARRWYANPANAERKCEYMREYYFNMPSIQRIEKDLRDRRAKALRRIAKRKERLAESLAEWET